MDLLSDDSDLSSVPPSPRSSPAPGRLPTRQKRRRNPLPKERTTQYLNLSLSSAAQQSQINLLVETVRRQKDIVVIAGAGISTSAGIPDFRSTDGLFKSLQKKHNLKASGKLLFDAAVYQDDALTAPFHEMVRSLSVEAAKTHPTPFHQMLARLGKESRLKRLYTQNIDGIETSMPPLATEVPLGVKGRWPVTIQLHGSIEKMVCQKCRYLCDLDPNRFNESDPPACNECLEKDDIRQMTGQRSHGVGRMRPRIVLYNEHNPDEEAITSVMNADIKSRPRVLIVAGTSLKIPGVRRLVKSLCAVIRSRKDGVTMFINNEPPIGKEFENCFDLVIQGSCDQVAHVANLKSWEDETLGELAPNLMPEPKRIHEECSSSEAEQEKSTRGIDRVEIKSTPKKRPRTDTGLFTPSSSNDEKPSTSPTKVAAKGKMANPASNGRTINDVLKGNKTAPAKPGRKKPAATTKRGKKPEPAKNAKINTFSTRVTKNTTAPASKKGTKGGNGATGKLHLLSVGAARNNGSMFPNLPNKAVMDGDGKPLHVDSESSPESMPHLLTAS
ncbi:hypothetical protein NUU61_006717 [Penicillium alfredii]|uniref:Deacetylase sirtuin-type domain-containing protein n=1 Tax=Penicillium alfredii TaxID=1506179 RepID=A0A9W9K4I5_9EURO|nr:uncharacterized protein NUU61_006717 [Penicillium alfredii]KAJ5091847.1 hypothetical protein NUU61_006717 [Penicillium alfredii]